MYENPSHIRKNILTENEAKKLGLRIKELRKEKNFSQEELADLSGLDRTYINSIENGRRNISIINIEKIASAFNLTLKDFFNF
mgnify:CR=1 FL=1